VDEQVEQVVFLVFPSGGGVGAQGAHHFILYRDA
jgi:hypothetical protein